MSALGLLLLWAGAVVFGVVGGGLVVLATANLPGPQITAVAVSTAVHVGWVVVPVVAASLDATLDARSFELLPVRPRQLGLGLLVAGVVGPGGLLTVLTVGIGMGFGLWPGWIGWLTVPVLTLLHTFIVIVTGRLVTTFLSDALRTSKAQGLGQAVAVVVGIGAVLGTGAAWNLTGLVDNGLPEQMLWLAAVPSGSVGAAFASLEAGSFGPALGYVAWAVAGAVLLTWAYGRALVRSQTRAPTGRSSRVSGDAGLLGSRLQRVLSSGPVRAALAKEMRYLRRDPRLRAQFVGGLMTVAVIGIVAASFLDSPYAPFFAVVATWGVIATVAPNQFGVDAGSFWVYVVAPADPSAALLGKNATWVAVAAPVAVTAAVAGAVVAGDWTYVAAALLASGATLLVWMGVGNVTSVYGAFPLPERQLFGSNPGGRALLVSLAGLAVSGVLSGPVVVTVALAALFGGAVSATLAAAGGLVYSALLYRVTCRWAGTLVEERRFHLIDALDER